MTNSTWRALKRSWQLYLLILPLVAYLFLFSYLPMYGVQIAFRDFRPKLGVWGSPWAGMKHFIRFFQFPNFWKVLRNTVVLSLYGVATFPCAVVFALMLNELRAPKFKRCVQMLSYAPHFLSTVVLCGMLMLFLNRSNGVFNNLRAGMGWERADYLSDPRCFAHIYVWSGVWQGLGWSSIIYLAALSGVSGELVEAARIDGANRMQVIEHIHLPALMPTVVILLILSCGSILSVGFDKAYLLQNSLNLDASQIIATYVYEIGIIDGQFSYSSAIGLFNNVVNVALLLLVNAFASWAADVSVL